MQPVQPLRKTGGWFFTKLNILLPYPPAITLLGVYPKELKTHVRVYKTFGFPASTHTAALPTGTPLTF